jgi:hypothetical protein
MKALPTSLEEVFQAAARFEPSAASGSRPEAAAAAMQQRQVQTQLIRGRSRFGHLLADQLPTLVKPVRLGICYFVAIMVLNG